MTASSSSSSSASTADGSEMETMCPECNVRMPAFCCQVDEMSRWICNPCRLRKFDTLMATARKDMALERHQNKLIVTLTLPTCTIPVEVVLIPDDVPIGELELYLDKKRGSRDRADDPYTSVFYQGTGAMWRNRTLAEYGYVRGMVVPLQKRILLLAPVPKALERALASTLIGNEARASDGRMLVVRDDDLQSLNLGPGAVAVLKVPN